MALTLLPAFATVALLLVLAGLVKVVRPVGTAGALLAAGLPGSEVLARGLGTVEIALGALCLLAPSRPAAAALALAYIAFAAVVLRLRRVGASCGCFGADGPPAGLLHAGLDGVAALVAAAAAVAGPAALPELLDRAPGEIATVALAVGAATYAGFLAFTVLPQVWDSWLTGEPTASEAVMSPQGEAG